MAVYNLPFPLPMVTAAPLQDRSSGGISFDLLPDLLGLFSIKLFSYV